MVSKNRRNNSFFRRDMICQPNLAKKAIVNPQNAYLSEKIRYYNDFFCVGTGMNILKRSVTLDYHISLLQCKKNLGASQAAAMVGFSFFCAAGRVFWRARALWCRAPRRLCDLHPGQTRILGFQHFFDHGRRGALLALAKIVNLLQYNYGETSGRNVIYYISGEG